MKDQKICTACGTQFPVNSTVEICTICAEERQYIPETGQSWTTQEAMLKNYNTRIVQLNERLFELVIDPVFAIGQRAFFGNIYKRKCALGLYSIIR